MTPAEELAAAADKLDALLAKTAPDWRLDNDNHLGLYVVEMPAMIGATKTSNTYAVSGPNDATTQYIAAMNPPVGEALAELLREQSSAAAVRDGHSATALKLARLINGGAA